jgi:predicted anti-sigma-YlaC factor YlaD
MADPEELACRDFVEVVSDYLEGALDERTHRRFEEHVAECGGCETYLEQIRTTVVAAGSLRTRELEPETRDALLGLFRGWVPPSPG